jgi:D-alanyl-D-alanine dipeptidase
MTVLPGLALAAELPPGFVRIQDVAPQIRQEMRYAGPDNFIGRPIAGYEAADCWLIEAAARALVGASRDAASLGWRLVVYDCYRPERAVADFVAWSKDPERQERKAEYYPDFDKADLFELGFIATRSQHSKGTTVDIGAEAVDASGKVTKLDFGTPFDTFAANSATGSTDIPPAAREARAKLVALLAGHGFDNYRKEWWHFTFAVDPAPPSYDLPITND